MVKTWRARRFLKSARRNEDPFYAAYVLVLVLGLRRGEVLGLAWEDVDLDNAEVFMGWQVQRIAGQLIRRQTKTEASDLTRAISKIHSWVGAADLRCLGR